MKWNYLFKILQLKRFTCGLYFVVFAITPLVIPELKEVKSYLLYKELLNYSLPKTSVFRAWRNNTYADPFFLLFYCAPIATVV